MPIPTPDTYLGRQFAAYGDGWPASDHADAMACRDLEQAIAYGLHLYQFILVKAEQIDARLAVTGDAYDLPAAKEVETLFLLWLKPAAVATGHVDAMEAKGYAVDRADEFRRAVIDAEVSTSVPVERAAAVCERIAREGYAGSATTEDLRRELRNRVGA